MANRPLIDGEFTSESVCSGHPDKIADQISDAILDAVLAQDPYGHVAADTAVTENRVILVGELRTTAQIDAEEIARTQIRRLGYTDASYRFSDQAIVNSFLHEQSPEIAVGVDNEGAGDQGMMFGYATQETKNLMPTAIAIAHRLTREIDTARETKALPYLRPDGKSQVTVLYEHGKPVDITSVVVAVPHAEEIPLEQVKQDVYEQIVTKVLAEFGFAIPLQKLMVNGTSVWHQGGPAADSGLTGRKIIADSYGGYARAGGGAFSGKDPTKVDRSGAYFARFLAKNIVAHGLAETAEVRLAYAIGQRYPTSLEVEDFGTLAVAPAILRDFLSKIAKKSVAEIIADLKLRETTYLPTASYGHFGRDEFPWEQIIEV